LTIRPNSADNTAIDPIAKQRSPRKASHLRALLIEDGLRWRGVKNTMKQRRVSFPIKIMLGLVVVAVLGIFTASVLGLISRVLTHVHVAAR